MSNEVKGGSYTGTGASVTIELGWIPDMVQVWNTTDGDNKWTWFYGMGAGDSLFERAVIDNATTGNASMALDTAGCIDSYAGSATSGSEAAPGFTTGADLSESGKTFYWRAERWSSAG